jgi:hypothetical protein
MAEPITPPDLDLRDFAYMPLDVVRLRDSDMAVIASGEAFRAAVMLWCASWHQVPAASLPSDEKLLANLAGYGRDLKSWRAVSEVALRGFILCTDNRYYHPVIADKAIEAGSKRIRQRSRTQAATEARLRASAGRQESRNGQTEDECNGRGKPKRHEPRNDARNDQAAAARHEHQGKGKEGKEERKEDPSQGRTLSIVAGGCRDQ